MNLTYFTAENIRKDALAGIITGMVAVSLILGIEIWVDWRKSPPLRLPAR